MSKGWIQLRRTADTFELLKEKNVFHLLTSIALRAKRTTDFNVEGLKPGEALIGDYEKYGMTRQEYRTAKKKLERWRFATFRATNKGTIAKLIDKRVYDINEETEQPPEKPSTNHQATNQQPSKNHQATTNKNDNNDNNEKKEKKDNRSSSGLELSKEQTKTYGLLIQHGVTKDVAHSLVYEQNHPLESIEAAIKNALVKKTELSLTDKFRADQFNLAGYIVASLNKAGQKGKTVNESKSVKALKVRKKLQEIYKPPRQEEFDAEKHRQLEAFKKKENGSDK